MLGVLCCGLLLVGAVDRRGYRLHFSCTFVGMPFPVSLQTILLDQTKLQLFVPDAIAVRFAYEKGAIPFPYWSQVWPAAKALAQFILQRPHYTGGKKVLELGGGLGLPSLVAARNAQQVLCTDVAAEAVDIVRQSAAHLHLQNFRADVLDWQYVPQALQADVLLLSDINYEPAAFAAMQRVIDFFLNQGTTILLSTPQRLMAKNFIAPLLAHCTRQQEIAVVHERSQVPITIIVVEQKDFS